MSDKEQEGEEQAKGRQQQEERPVVAQPRPRSLSPGVFNGRRECGHGPAAPRLSPE